MLKIWGRINSINVRKVVWAAREAGAPFERIDAGREFGLVNTPEYLNMNPNALIPVVADGDLLLWESNVIVRYLCAKFAPDRLYPLALGRRFDAERWMDWQQTTLNPATRHPFQQLVRTAPEKRDAALIAQSNLAAERLFAVLDEHLATRAFMLGDEFTMADIPLGCEAHRWFGLPQQHAPRPNVERWFEQLRERPATKDLFTWPLT